MQLVQAPRFGGPFGNLRCLRAPDTLPGQARGALPLQAHWGHEYQTARVGAIALAADLCGMEQDAQLA